MSGTEAVLIADAFPKDAEGWPLCGHCGKQRKATLMLCYRCWHALSAFVQIEILHAPTELEKAHLIVQTRPSPASSSAAVATDGARDGAAAREGGDARHAD